MSRLTLVLPLSLLFAAASSAQQTAATQKPSPVAVIPAQAAKQANPIKTSPESLARAKKWWGLDCAMCHGKDGDGKGDVAKDMKLQITDFTDPSTLKDRTDGQLFYIIKNGQQDMPPEGDRVKTDELWDLVNYIRSFARKKPESEQKPTS